MTLVKDSSSFRDPSGFIFYHNGIVCRQINAIYRDHYDYFVNSGLYKVLAENRLIVSHDEISNMAVKKLDGDVYKVIRPQLIPFISYPYEWCFSQLKDAALSTLRIQKMALKYGMVLKDCSAYNIQFFEGKPIFIDTLSFEIYNEGQPWCAYRQFCQHFLSPLVLMSLADIRHGQLLKIYIDGIPLDMTISLLPIYKFLYNYNLLFHIFLHAKSQKYVRNKYTVNSKKYKLSRSGFCRLIDSLEAAVVGLKYHDNQTEWSAYYEELPYSLVAFQHKKQIVDNFLDMLKPDVVWDMGANTGIFSQIAADKGIRVIAFDSDPAAVEKNYIECIKASRKNILPLLMDITNPSPDIGWNSEERLSLIKRCKADTVLALALVHHLSISNNVPLSKLANFFKGICKSLIIEFVPKTDLQVKRLLSTRQDIFHNYTKESFELEFSKYFRIANKVSIKDSQRTLYLMTRD